MSKPYDCDSCGRTMPCCTYRDTPHGDGWFCHRCRSEADAECEDCTGVKWVLRLRASTDMYMGPNKHWVVLKFAYKFPSFDEATAFAESAGYKAETRVEILDDEVEDSEAAR
jgi:hypothetical protein